MEHLSWELFVPDHENNDDPKPYPGNIEPGSYYDNEIVDLLREHKENPDAIQFIADMLEI